MSRFVREWAMALNMSEADCGRMLHMNHEALNRVYFPEEPQKVKRSYSCLAEIKTIPEDKILIMDSGLSFFNQVENIDLDDISIGSLDHFLALEESTKKSVKATVVTQHFHTSPNLRRISLDNNGRDSTSSSTPYGSLKDLVDSKRKRNSNGVDSLLSGLSSEPNRKRHKSEEGATFLIDPAVKSETDDAIDDSLHKACREGHSREQITGLINSQRAGCKKHIEYEKLVYNFLKKETESILVHERYQFPINIAIKNGLDRDIIMLIFDAAPSAILERDGAAGETSLHVLLHYMPQDIELLRSFLLYVKQSSRDIKELRDARDNTLLHTACKSGTASLRVIQLLVRLHPEALLSRDFNDETPLQVSQRTGNSNDLISHLLLLRS